MRSGTRVAAIAACASLLALGGAPEASASSDWRWCPDWNVKASSTTLSSTISSIYCVLNAQRMQHGLKPLRWNWRLWWAAQKMGGDMVERQFFAHVTPDGRGLAERVDETGYLPPGDDWSLGENLGWGEGVKATPVAIVAGWMMSPGHRENMLDPDFREIGIACVMGSPFEKHPDGAVFVAEFGHATVVRKASKLQRHA